MQFSHSVLKFNAPWFQRVSPHIYSMGKVYFFVISIEKTAYWEKRMFQQYCRHAWTQLQTNRLKEINHVLLFFFSVAAPPNKKRVWSWPAYLEEERAIAAPVKLFKEVFFLWNTAQFSYNLFFI